MRSIVTAVLATFLLWTPLRSQDIHFTLFDMMPVVFNPAESGNFYGTYRIAGLYRDQWVSVTGLPGQFKTPALSVDAPIIKGFRENDWVGIGGFFYSDKAGSLGLSNTAFKLSASYHFALNKKGTTVITLGYQTGSVGRKIKASKWNDIVLESNNWDPGGGLTDPDLATIISDDVNKSFIDHVIGLHLKAQGKTSLLQLGFSVANIAGSDASLLGNSGFVGGGSGPDTTGRRRNVRMAPSKFIGTAAFRAQTNSRFAIHPKAFVQFLGKASEIVVRFEGEYLLNPEKQFVLRGGLGYRFGDAAQLVAGMDIRNDWKFTFGYDINISKLTPASQTVGGFELSVVYIGKIYKKPDPEPILFCPRF